MNFISPCLKRLYLSHIPSLKEFPSSFQSLNRLEDLRIKYCKNLEILPNGINLESLCRLNISWCLRLKTFPDISTNITRLGFFRTGVEEVPSWIDKFTKLEYVYMPNCNKLKRVSLNLFKSKHLTNSEAVTEDSCHDHLPVVALCFIDCFNLDHKAILQQESIIKYIILPGVRVPSYFSHRTSRNSLTNIPLLQFQSSFSSLPFFRFRACAVFEESMSPKACLIDIKVSCRFRDRLGNHFDSTDHSCSFWTYQHGRHMVIFDCRFPLYDGNSPHIAQLKYELVDIKFHLTDDLSKFSLKGCGIRLPHDSTPSPGSRAIVEEDITEADESNMEDNETEESVSNGLETETRRKRITVVMER